MFASWSLSKEQGRFMAEGDAIPRSVVLTLDRTLQYIVEQELAAVLKKTLPHDDDTA